MNGLLCVWLLSKILERYIFFFPEFKVISFFKELNLNVIKSRKTLKIEALSITFHGVK